MKVQVEINIPTEVLDVVAQHLNCTQDQLVNNKEAVQCIVQHLVDEIREHGGSEMLGNWLDDDHMFPILSAIIDKDSSNMTSHEIATKVMPLLRMSYTFMDDHIICLGIHTSDTKQDTDTSWLFDLMWVGEGGYAAFKYRNSSKDAMNDAIKYLRTYIVSVAGELLEAQNLKEEVVDNSKKAVEILGLKDLTTEQLTSIADEEV